MNITTGNNGYKIIATGSIISFKDENINFDFAPGVRVVIKFIIDENQSENQIDHVNSANSLDILFINCDRALNLMTTEPMQMGFIEGRNLYLNLAINSTGRQSQKLLNYTFYLRETR